MCQREVSHYGPEYEQYVEREAPARRDPLQLPYSGASPRTARETFRTKLLKNLISKLPEASLQNNYASFRASRIRTADSAYRTRPGVPIETYPSLLPSLGFENFVPKSTAACSRSHPAPTTNEDAHWACQYSNARVSFGQTDFRAQPFNDNIVTFTDQGTMTARVTDASCGMSTPRHSTNSLEDSFCSADKQPKKSRTFGRSNFVQSVDRIRISRTAARNCSPGRNRSAHMKEIKSPTRDMSEELFDSNENYRIMAQRSGRHIGDEEINAVFDIQQTSKSRRSRTPSPKSLRCFAAKVSVGCYVDQHPIPHSHSPSKYHGNCLPDTRWATQGWLDSTRSKGIKLPRRLITSDKSVDYYDRRRK